MKFPKYRLMEETKDGDAGEGTVAGQATSQAGAGDGAGAQSGAGQGKDSGTGQGSGPAWPSDWRNQFAGNDDKEVKQLERFASPADVWRKARALEQRLSSGELKAVTPFPEKGTPEQQTAWRAENGIPESPDKYQINLGEGVVIGEQDKPIIDDFLKAAHASNTPANVANAAVKWYFDFAEKQREARYEQDQQAKAKFEDTMRPEWGGEYRPNLNSVHALLDMAPEGVKDKFLNGRLADGTPIGSDPDTLRWLANLSRQLNPVTAIVPGAGANIPQAIDDELSQISAKMADRGSDYYKGEQITKDGMTGTKTWHRYQELLRAKEQHKGRAA